LQGVCVRSAYAARLLCSCFQESVKRLTRVDFAHMKKGPPARQALFVELLWSIVRYRSTH
jgi:hypothetical protein